MVSNGESTLYLKRPDNQFGHLDSIGQQQKRRRNHLETPQQPNQDAEPPEMQRTRAMEVDQVDI
jgi:hypothetical protein